MEIFSFIQEYRREEWNHSFYFFRRESNRHQSEALASSAQPSSLYRYTSFVIFITHRYPEIEPIGAPWRCLSTLDKVTTPLRTTQIMHSFLFDEIPFFPWLDSWPQGATLFFALHHLTCCSHIINQLVNLTESIRLTTPPAIHLMVTAKGNSRCERGCTPPRFWLAVFFFSWSF